MSRASDGGQGGWAGTVAARRPGRLGRHGRGAIVTHVPAKRKPTALGPRGGLRAAFSRGLEIQKAANDIGVMHMTVVEILPSNDHLTTPSCTTTNKYHVHVQSVKPVQS